MPVVASWKSIGTALRLKPNVLERIQAEKNGKARDCMASMVREWLSQNYNVKKFGEPTWQKLVKAVSHPAGGADMGHAKCMATNHTPLAIGMITSDNCLIFVSSYIPS